MASKALSFIASPVRQQKLYCEESVIKSVEQNSRKICIVGDVVYGMEEPVPAEQPCLKCRCQPPGVQCETLQCEKRPGCKAIHKPNKCCPDYQCECEHNGKFYANGERLETVPGGECKVCYCRGGEVQCAEVSCYMRKDCEGKQVPGKCCPKYDHCPPIDPIPGRPYYTTEITLSNLDKENFEPWPITGSASNATDNVLNPTSNDIQEENKILTINDYETSTTSFRATEVDDLQKEVDVGIINKITIQEIIPERKEIPITAPPRIELEPQGTLIIEEAEEFLNHSNDLVVTDSDADSSEISEVFQQPPPVLRIGDKLKDTSTPNSVITIIGAEGLQRGFEDSGEIHEVKIDNLPKDITGNESQTTVLPVDVTDLILNTDENSNKKEVNVTELNTSYSTHILSLVKKENNPSNSIAELSTATSITITDESRTISTTEATSLLETSFTSSATELSNETLTSTTEGTDILKTTLDVSDSIATEGIKNSTEAIPVAENIETNYSTPVYISTKNYDSALEHNPAYPPLSELMSPHIDDTSQRFDMDTTEKDEEANVTTIPMLKILPEVLAMRSNKTVPQNLTNSEWLKINPHTLINYGAVLPDDLLSQPALSDFQDTTEDFSTTATPDTTDVITTTIVSETETSRTNDITNAVTDAVTVEENDTEYISTTSVDITASTEESARSVETVEDYSEDSGEATTKKHSHASILSNENASVESKRPDSSEAEDMVSSKNAGSDNSGEQTTQPAGDDRAMIDKEWKKNTTDNGNTKEVEIIDTSTLKKKKPIERTIDATTVDVVDIETTQPPSKVIEKRENSPADEQTLEKLYSELNAEISEQNATSYEQKYAEEVFKQLLESTSTTKPTRERAEPRNKDTETLQKVSNALELSLKGKDPDSGILGTLIKFFNSQYQSYDKK
ncbi:hypothetical protein NQ318_009850 [Aromia moschata]|uniref:VWFC domain-containing protein n=1 Tax=Aromia moschata TaxID=1265417 RepID=A0AAV8XA64_9CUCU|nr:hypothetical protein NQ318_009850 [Aromia moschata]